MTKGGRGAVGFLLRPSRMEATETCAFTTRANHYGAARCAVGGETRAPALLLPPLYLSSPYLWKVRMAAVAGDGFMNACLYTMAAGDMGEQGVGGRIGRTADLAALAHDEEGAPPYRSKPLPAASFPTAVANQVLLSVLTAHYFLGWRLIS